VVIGTDCTDSCKSNLYDHGDLQKGLVGFGLSYSV